MSCGTAAPCGGMRAGSRRRMLPSVNHGEAAPRCGPTQRQKATVNGRKGTGARGEDSELGGMKYLRHLG